MEDLAEREHGDGFWSLPGTPVPAAKPDILRAEDSAPVGPLTVGRKGRAAQPRERLASKLEWAETELMLKAADETGAAARRTEETRLAAAGKALPIRAR